MSRNRTARAGNDDAPPAEAEAPVSKRPPDASPAGAQAERPPEEAEFAPHPAVYRLEAARKLPLVDADAQVWEGYRPPREAIHRFVAGGERKVMEVVCLAGDRSLAQRKFIEPTKAKPA